MDMGLKEARTEILEVEAHGDTAIEVSKYILHGKGGAELDAASSSSSGSERMGSGSCTGTSLAAANLLRDGAPSRNQL
jgi:hypothetical protein